MAKRRTIKLFAVAMLAGAGSAEAKPRVDWASYIDSALVRAIVPRTLDNGRPACGNTGGKKASPCRVETKQPSTVVAAPAPAPVVIKPRVLPSGRPACGNTGGKTASDDDCMAAEVTNL